MVLNFYLSPLLIIFILVMHSSIAVSLPMAVDVLLDYRLQVLRLFKMAKSVKFILVNVTLLLSSVAGPE